MATRFLRSTDGNDADDGSTWALAKAKLSGIDAIDTAGDRIYVSDNHSETGTAAITIALAGTLADPTEILCVDDTGDPASPTALATTGVIEWTTSQTFTMTGSCYVYGLTFRGGAAGVASNAPMNFNTTGGHQQVFEQCTFFNQGSASTNKINFGAAATIDSSRVELIGCQWKHTHASQTIQVSRALTIKGGGLGSGTTAVTILMTPFTQRPVDVLVDGADLSLGASTMSLIAATNSSGKIVFRDCKMPNSWTGALFSAALTVPGLRGEMWNCTPASDNTTYRFRVEDHFGNAREETTLVKTGGASDGSTPLSWKIVTTANAQFPHNIFCSPEIFGRRIESADVGNDMTATVDILHDSATALNDDEVWLEIMYVGVASGAHGTVASDRKADILAAAAAQASSSATWTTTGMTNPNARKLTVSFTPQMQGEVIGKVCVAKASQTLYVDPVLQFGDAGTMKSFQLPGMGQVNILSASGGGGNANILNGSVIQ